MAEAKIECRGWWSTLEWRYYANAAGRVVYEDMDSWYGREVGEDDRPIFAQSFQQTSGVAWNASKIDLRVRKVDEPVDNLLVALYSDAAGDPNASLSGTG